jgi:hypothetical protein
MIYIPGTKDDSLRFASSLVRNFSSDDLGIPAGFNFPPGHRLSRKSVMYDRTRGSLRRVLKFSRIFLLSLFHELEGEWKRRKKRVYRSTVPPRTCCRMITIA